MKEFTDFHLFSGIGGGALGFKHALGRYLALVSRFRCLGGIDIDPQACADFQRLTESPATCADIRTMTVREMYAAAQGECPDVIFSSPPCKGLSSLLSNEKHATEHYQAMNRLVVQGLFIALEAFAPKRPKLIVLENVPRIRTRGAGLLHQVRQLLMSYGYQIHEGTHDCGELGGLAQHRRRFLMIARHAEQVPHFVYRAPTRRVRAIGELLETLPLPDDPRAGPMHRLPRLQWKTWVRLALIPAGGDWRALGTAEGPAKFNNQFRIIPWDGPSVAVTGGGTPTAGGICVGDPRFPDEHRRGAYRVVRWTDPSGTVTANGRPAAGFFTVADPRLGDHYNKLRVEAWTKPAHTVTASDRVGSGAPSVADPRMPCVDNDRPDPPVIISEDGTWHRPLTTFELAALQGFPVFGQNGDPLVLSGKSHERWREGIGNAVPPPAAQAIAESLLAALLPSWSGAGYVMGGTDIWVREEEEHAAV